MKDDSSIFDGLGVGGTKNRDLDLGRGRRWLIFAPPTGLFLGSEADSCHHQQGNHNRRIANEATGQHACIVSAGEVDRRGAGSASINRSTLTGSRLAAAREKQSQ